jgi:hypothetical protein
MCPNWTDGGIRMKESELWSYSINDDYKYNGELCKSREEAIQRGIEDALDEELTTGTLYVGKINNFVPVVDANVVLERIMEDASYEAGEFAEDYLKYTKSNHVNELQAMLQKSYEEWESRHSEYRATFYLISETEEFDIEKLLQSGGTTK